MGCLGRFIRTWASNGVVLDQTFVEVLAQLYSVGRPAQLQLVFPKTDLWTNFVLRFNEPRALCWARAPAYKHFWKMIFNKRVQYMTPGCIVSFLP
jgi:hypothetical protein